MLPFEPTVVGFAAALDELEALGSTEETVVLAAGVLAAGVLAAGVLLLPVSVEDMLCVCVALALMKVLELVLPLDPSHSITPASFPHSTTIFQPSTNMSAHH